MIEHKKRKREVQYCCTCSNTHDAAIMGNLLGLSCILVSLLDGIPYPLQYDII